MKSPIFKLTAVNDFSNPAVKNSKELKKWLHELPILNFEVSIRALSGSIEFCNSEPLKFKQRIDLIQCYFVMTNKLFYSIEKLGIYIPFD